MYFYKNAVTTYARLFFFFFFFCFSFFPFQLNSPSKDELDMFRCTVETLKKHRTKPDKTKNETQETR